MTNPSRGELVPGGLAMVHGIRKHPEINGRFVTLIEFSEFLCFGEEDPVHGWDCKAPWISDYAIGDTAVFYAKNLMPINPEPDPLEITQHQEQSA